MHARRQLSREGKGIQDPSNKALVVSIPAVSTYYANVGISQSYVSSSSSVSPDFSDHETRPYIIFLARPTIAMMSTSEKLFAFHASGIFSFLCIPASKFSCICKRVLLMFTLSIPEDHDATACSLEMRPRGYAHLVKKSTIQPRTFGYQILPCFLQLSLDIHCQDTVSFIRK